MSKQDKYKPGPNDFLDYSEGKLKGRKRNAFERYLEQNLFDAEAAEGFSMVSREEAGHDLAAAGSKIKWRVNRRKRIGWYSAAAAIISILAISTIFLNVDNTISDKQESIPELPKGMEPAAEKKAEKSDMHILERDEAQGKGGLAEKEDKKEAVLTEEAMDEKTMDEELTPPVGAGAVAEEIKVEADAVEAVARDVEPAAAVEKEVLDFAMDEEDMERMEVKEEAKMEALAAPAQQVVSGKEKSAVKMMAPDSENASPLSVRGVVLSAEDSSPIPGATIMLKGTSVGTVADADGNFELKIADAADQKIVASYIGMESEELPVQAGADVKILMSESTLALEEVVVVGYNSSRRAQVAGSVQSIDNSIIGAVPEIGLSAYNDYINNELVFPRSEYNLSRAVVVVRFVVQPNKRPYNIQIDKSPSQAFSNEAQRVIFSGPDWTPASKNGVYVEDEVSLQIVFKEEHKR